jgi:hypothetical protein
MSFRDSVLIRSIPLLLVALALGACSADSSLPPLGGPQRVELEGGDTAASPPPPEQPAPGPHANGSLAERIVILDAFLGRRAPADTGFTVFTVEGQPIHYRARVRAGEAIVTRDGRADGSTLETHTLVTLGLIHVVPGVWKNGVEVTKEQYVPVDAQAAMTTPGTYYLQGQCPNKSCELWF